ncbi:hypothetical protein [Microcoleus phage My-WqHQDG]|nr:hypothetical protein [Microcoleus phage My-WqHQDG]
MGTTYVYHQASSMHQDTTKIMSWEGAPGDGEYISIHYTDRSRWGPNAVTVIGPTLVENLLTGMMEEVYQSQFTPCKDHNNAD